jgi:hypothetical protein
MGEAKRRGTFEERKAQAIAAGRIKHRPQFKARRSVGTMGPALRLLFALLRGSAPVARSVPVAMVAPAEDGPQVAVTAPVSRRNPTKPLGLSPTIRRSWRLAARLKRAAVTATN